MTRSPKNFLPLTTVPSKLTFFSMDRQGIIGVALAVLLLFAWQYQNQKNYQQTQKAPQATASASPGTPSVAPGSPSASPRATVSPSVPSAISKPAIAEPTVEPKTEQVSGALADFTFTNLGGGISRVKLPKHKGAKPGELMILNTLGAHPIGAVLVNPEDPSNPAYNVSVQDGQVVCERTNPDGIRITKTFSIASPGKPAKDSAGPGEYRAGLDLAFTNTGTAPVDQPSFFVFAGSAEPIHPADLPTYTGLDWQRDGKSTFTDVNWFKPERPIYSISPGDVTWAGVKNQYFTSILTPATPAKGVWAAPLYFKVDSKDLKGVQGAIEMSGFKLNPGESIHRQFTLYTGPKEYRRLAQLGHGETEMMNFGWFKIISIFLLRVMNKLNDVVGNYAWAIIILTFVVRGALWPIQGAATKSMKRMSLLQPKMTELKEKYKDDPTKMNQEVMKLYKDYGVNPFAGCLPMLIQIPIFFGFYSMLGTAVELRNSHFLWVKDLSMPDTVFTLAGLNINILPLCMAGTMIWQMSLSPKSGDPAQQKMMMFMPLIFVFLTYNFASALALYYTIQNILSIFQLYVTRNQAAPTLERATPSKGGGRKPGRR